MLQEISFYNDEVFITVPRLERGVPSTLNIVLTSRIDGVSPVLKPIPSLEYNTLGDCNALQSVHGMEIDHNTGMMWAIDAGRALSSLPSADQIRCPAKIVVFDMKNLREHARYVFPTNVVDSNSSLLGRMVLGYEQGQNLTHVYIVDISKGIVVYNIIANTSHRHEDSASMQTNEGVSIPVDGILLNSTVNLNSLAISSDFKYVYFSSLSGVKLYQVPASALNDPNTNIGNHIRLVGSKPANSAGMFYATKNLYFGGLGRDNLYRWRVSEDVNTTEGEVTMNTVEEVAQHSSRFSWVESMSTGASQSLHITVSNRGRMSLNMIDFSNPDPNFFVLKCRIGEKGYLSSVTLPAVNITPVIPGVCVLLGSTERQESASVLVWRNSTYAHIALLVLLCHFTIR
ncbi:protein yellow-like [Liolophura sinensis]|uniref:protein yellow-like n=1 Tax=Liolophura sinensis TaxID=3198878 RepID=UPI00315867E4